MIEKLPGGTKGARSTPSVLNRLLMPMMVRIHRRSGDKFQGMNLLYITTTGAKSGQSRTNPVARFDAGDGGWFVVASAGGATHHPGWYHNVVKHPDQVMVEVSGTRRHVHVEQLEGDERAKAWTQITTEVPRFAGYPTKTDRPIPVLHLTPDDAAA